MHNFWNWSHATICAAVFCQTGIELAEGQEEEEAHARWMLNKEYVIEMADNDNVVPVCTNESYLHNNHLSGMSYITRTQN